MPNNIDMGGFGAIGLVSLSNKLGGIDTFGSISNTTLYPIQSWYANGILVGRLTRDGTGAATLTVTNSVNASLSFLADALTGVNRISATAGGFINYIALSAYSFQFYMASSFVSAYYTGQAWVMPSGGSYGWSSNAAGSTTSDTQIVRDAANIVNVRNGTNACTFRVTRSYTDGSNYSWLTAKWNTSTAVIHAEGAGTGSDGSVAFNDAALATNATVGFMMIPSCAGTPTGVPADIPTGQIPLVWDSTNLKLYAYTGGAWKASAAFT